MAPNYTAIPGQVIFCAHFATIPSDAPHAHRCVRLPAPRVTNTNSSELQALVSVAEGGTIAPAPIHGAKLERVIPYALP